MKVAVVGLGKIGLPLAIQYASKGHAVTGIDIDSNRVDLINQGVEPFPGEANLEKLLRTTLGTGALRATTSYEKAISGANVVVVVVPLVLDSKNQPNFVSLDAATESIGRHLQSGTLVIYETTLPIGTTRGRWAPHLEKASGLTQGKDFDVVFSPERVLTGRIFADLRQYPKLLGGLSAAGASKAKAFYDSALSFDNRPDLVAKNGVWDLGSAEAAEMAKLAETTYRDVNIALANQFALHADELGIDIYSVIDACNSQPFSHIHQPGISVGGHCIPVYPRLYLASDSQSGVVGAARELNSAMPLQAIDSLTSHFGGLRAKNILILGVSYRPGVKEDSYSGAHALRKSLEARGAEVFAIDPMYSGTELETIGFRTPVSPLEVDGIILHTGHEEFKELSISDFPSCQHVYDGRNVLDKKKWPGCEVVILGKKKSLARP